MRVSCESFPSHVASWLSCRHCLSKLRLADYIARHICSSLFTSLVPPLALFGVGSAIAMSSRFRAKVLLLNSSYDRESENLTAIDFVSRSIVVTPSNCARITPLMCSSDCAADPRCHGSPEWEHRQPPAPTSSCAPSFARQEVQSLCSR